MKALAGLAAILFVVCLSGCGSKTVTLENELDPDAVQAALEPGNNSIHGSSAIILQNGDKVPGGEFPVSLFPVTPNSTERMARIFGSTDRGFLKNAAGAPKFEDRERFQSSGGRTVNPDATGKFTFPNLKDGEYFVVTSVSWKPANSYYGNEVSLLMQKVRLSGGEKKEIVLSHPEPVGAASK